MSPSKFHGAGIHFNNEYQSEVLAHILEVIMSTRTASRFFKPWPEGIASGPNPQRKKRARQPPHRREKPSTVST
jgi:hypothetical protein